MRSCTPPLARQSLSATPRASSALKPSTSAPPPTRVNVDLDVDLDLNLNLNLNATVFLLPLPTRRSPRAPPTRDSLCPPRPAASLHSPPAAPCSAPVPSPVHEALRDLFRDRPALAAELLRLASDTDIPSHDAVRLVDSSVPQNSPPSLVADDVVELMRDGVPVLVVIVEIQLRKSRKKRRSWPVHVAAHARVSQCPAVLLVVTPDAHVAAWAAEPIHVGPGTVTTPIVVGPERVPRIVSTDDARDHVELAVLSALAHCNEPDGWRVVRAAWNAIGELDVERSRCYRATIHGALNDAAKRALEDEMQKSQAMKDLEDEFVNWVLAIGEKRGLAEGEARSILTVLEERGIALSPAERERVLACFDRLQLESWLRRAATVRSATELFVNVDRPGTSET